MASLDTLSATQIAAGVAAGDFTATEVARAALDAIEARDGAVQAFLQVSPELALDAAARIDIAKAEILDHRNAVARRLLKAFPNMRPAEHEALEYLLFLAIPRRDTNELAHRLIQHFGDFCKVMEAEPEELEQVEGIGPKSARLIHTVMAFGRYYGLKKRKRRVALDRAENAAEYVKPLFLGQQNELLYLILLDDKCCPVRDMRIAEGVPNRVHIDTRKLLRDVARTDATCAILAHNHPSGIATPSQEDIFITHYIRDALQPLGITLYDHVIMTDDDMVSLKDSRHLNSF